jgi:hypothetical protein
MKRFRLSTLVLLIVIAALGMDLLIQFNRAFRRDAELRARLAQPGPLFLKQQREDAELRAYIEEMQRRRRQLQAVGEPGR